MDVLSKGDLLPDLVSNSSTNTTYGSSLEQYLAFGPKETIKVSTVTGEGIEQVKLIKILTFFQYFCTF